MNRSKRQFLEALLKAKTLQGADFYAVDVRYGIEVVVLLEEGEYIIAVHNACIKRGIQHALAYFETTYAGFRKNRRNT